MIWNEAFGRHGKLFFLLVATVFGSGCSRSTLEGGSSDRPTVFVSIAPAGFLLERIAGGHVESAVMVGPGQAHETYEPTPQQMAALSGAALYFSVGLPFEDSLGHKAARLNAKLKVVNLAEFVELLPGDDGCGHPQPPGEAGSSGGHEHGHDHGGEGMDPHFWMDPLRMAKAASAMSGELEALLPEHAETFRKNTEKLVEDLKGLDSRMAVELDGLQGRNLYVFHGAFGYIANRYGLIQVTIEVGGKEPGAQRIAALIEAARKERARVIFVQPQFSVIQAETIARAISGELVELDPVSPDYMENMYEIARRISRHLRGDRLGEPR